MTLLEQELGDVLVARGNAARSVFAEPNSAIDSAIIAIVDSFDK